MAELTTEEIVNRNGDGDGKDSSAGDSQLRIQLAHWVTDRWDEAETAARQEAERQSWDNWVNAYWGEPSSESLPSYREPILTTEMRDLILHEAQEITDTKPRVHVLGKQLPKEVLSMAEESLQAKWDDCDLRGVIRESIVWSKILPCGWIGVYWDPMLNDGMGDIAVCAEDPRAILPAPQAKNDLTWPYVIKEDWLDLWSIKQRWPDTGGDVKEEAPPHISGQGSQNSLIPISWPNVLLSIIQP